MSDLIYSVEDDASIRELINYALSSAGFEVRSFEDAESMFKAAEERMPSLVLLDIMLPGMDGIEALKHLRARDKNLKIVMLTAKGSEVNKITGLDSGADDYITKPFSVLELTARIRAHLRNNSVSAEAALSFGGIELDPQKRTVNVEGREVNLTYKEFEILYMLFKNASKVVTRDELLREIWGFDYIGESRTVDIHIKNLRAKLGKAGDCISNVRGVGYVLREAQK